MQITPEQIKEAARGISKPIFKSTNAAADFETGFEEGAKWSIDHIDDEWIEIKSYKDLPSESHIIIFGRFTKDCPKTVYQAYFNPKNKNFYSDGIKSKDVSHWMPLPNPPKS